MRQFQSREAAFAPRHQEATPSELASSSLCRLTELLVHNISTKAAAKNEEEPPCSAPQQPSPSSARARAGRGGAGSGGQAPTAHSDLDRDRLRRAGRATLAAIQKAVDSDLPSGNAGSAEFATKAQHKDKQLLVEAGPEGSLDTVAEEPGWKSSSLELCCNLPTAGGRESPRGSESSTTEGASCTTELSLPSEDASSPGSDLGQSCSLPQDVSPSSPQQLETGRRLRRRRRAGRPVVHEATEGACVVVPGLQPQAVATPPALVAPPPGLELEPVQAQALGHAQELQANCAAAGEAAEQQEDELEEPLLSATLFGEPVALPMEMAAELRCVGLTSPAPNSSALPETPHAKPVWNKEAALVIDDHTVLIPKCGPSPQEAFAAELHHGTSCEHSQRQQAVVVAGAHADLSALPYSTSVKAVAIADAKAVLKAQFNGEPLKVRPLGMLAVWPEMLSVM